jgi:hypothetical protein
MSAESPRCRRDVLLPRHIFAWGMEFSLGKKKAVSLECEGEYFNSIAYLLLGGRNGLLVLALVPGCISIL